MTLLDTAPSARTRTAAPWVPVCRLEDLEPLWGEAALIGADQVALFLLPDGSVHVTSNADPATGAFVMSRGIVGSRAGRPTIASPLHKDVFDLETGACYTKPDLRLPTWRVRDRDGILEVAQRVALVAASHGTSDPAGRRAVAGLVDGVRRRLPATDVRDAFVDIEDPDVPSVLDALEDDAPAAIVPLLLSAGYHVHVDLAEAAAEASRSTTVTGALGPDRRLAVVLARRLREAGLAAGDSVVLAAAGSSDAAAVADCAVTADLLAAELGRPVAVSYISAASPRVADAVASARLASPGARVAVASYLLAPGYFATLAARAGGDLTSRPLLVDDEEPPAELVDIVVERYSSAV
ncbi:nitrite reductase small subunit NirD [Naasia sp. SYSU D00948]|uniref:nitrite reductase small subunit NirD n=1 Tax=Naasia sp. SYSU D00948 TaxID=2817379 RepID=UPI001B30A3DD|nr:nitrite reductase small subunit NirD [Naasia sp. SYSU D00948]